MTRMRPTGTPRWLQSLQHPEETDRTPQTVRIHIKVSYSRFLSIVPGSKRKGKLHVLVLLMAVFPCLNSGRHSPVLRWTRWIPQPPVAGRVPPQGEVSSQAVTQEIWRSQPSALPLPVPLGPITGDSTPRRACPALQGDMRLQA